MMKETVVFRQAQLYGVVNVVLVLLQVCQLPKNIGVHGAVVDVDEIVTTLIENQTIMQETVSKAV